MIVMVGNYSQNVLDDSGDLHTLVGKECADKGRLGDTVILTYVSTPSRGFWTAKKED
jgi:hypothetical protein